MVVRKLILMVTIHSLNTIKKKPKMQEEIQGE